jgi:hypothetical protein
VGKVDVELRLLQLAPSRLPAASTLGARRSLTHGTPALSPQLNQTPRHISDLSQTNNIHRNYVRKQLYAPGHQHGSQR